MSEYRPPDLAEAKQKMLKAFREGADFLCIYSKRQRVQMEMIRLCQTEGWLDDGEFVELDSQSSEYRYRLTGKGRALVDMREEHN